MKQNNFILKHSSEILKKFLENKETRKCQLDSSLSNYFKNHKNSLFKSWFK